MVQTSAGIDPAEAVGVERHNRPKYVFCFASSALPSWRHAGTECNSLRIIIRFTPEYMVTIFYCGTTTESSECLNGGVVGTFAG